MEINGKIIITVRDLKDMLARHDDSDPIMIDGGDGRRSIKEIVRRDPGQKCQPTLVIEG